MRAVNNNGSKEERVRESRDQIFKDFKLDVICANQPESRIPRDYIRIRGCNTGIAPAFRSSSADVSAVIRGILGVTNIPETKEGSKEIISSE